MTGVMLAVLALGHYTVTHIVNDVADTGTTFVAERWSSALWIIWDGLLLGAALVHVGAGLVTVVRDYRPSATSRRRWIRALVGLNALLLIIGVATLMYSVVNRT
jgi:succinate dehydrogenase / fumarate reductase membrane anchor subunit